MLYVYTLSIIFFFNDTATTEIYTLSLHDALPIYLVLQIGDRKSGTRIAVTWLPDRTRVQEITARQLNTERCKGFAGARDRKSTRLNSSHLVISYAVFCLKKKNDTNQ